MEYARRNVKLFSLIRKTANLLFNLFNLLSNSGWRNVITFKGSFQLLLQSQSKPFSHSKLTERQLETWRVVIKSRNLEAFVEFCPSLDDHHLVLL